MWTVFFRFVTIHAFRTDGRTEFSSLERVSFPCSVVKTARDDQFIFSDTTADCCRNHCDVFSQW